MNMLSICQKYNEYVYCDCVSPGMKRVFGMHIWKGDPPCAWRRNKRYPLNSIHCTVGLLPDIQITPEGWHAIQRDPDKL